MYSHYPLPIIIGTDLTGLVISSRLSQAGISHALIGEAPDNQLPRPGQIATPVGTVIFEEHFPELAHLAYPKRARVVYVEDYVLRLDFSHPLLTPLKPLLGALADVSFNYPANLDRVAIDKALYDKAIHSPFCTHLRSRVVDVAYEAASDKIRAVTLDDGTVISTSHVFDATGDERTIARQLALSCRTLDEPRRLIHAIYTTKDQGPAPVPQTADWYHHTASIVRLYKREEKAEESIDGFAICVPLGDSVAVHTSTPASDDQLSDETLLELAQSALGNYGVNYPAYFPLRTCYGSTICEQYVYERIYGANWLLTGTAYCSTLVTTGTHMDTSLAALYTAADFLNDPARLGAMYQKYMDYFLTMQEIWHWGMTHGSTALEESKLRKLFNRYMWVNTAQFFHVLRMKHRHTPSRPAIDMANYALDNHLIYRFSNLFASINRLNR